MTESKTITVNMTFDGKEFDLDKITPEYVLKILRSKGLETKGVTLTA